MVSVKRNVVDSFLVGENGCRDEPSVFVQQGLPRVNRMVGVCAALRDQHFGIQRRQRVMDVQMVASVMTMYALASVRDLFKNHTTNA